jgi:hypothetical protein
MRKPSVRWLASLFVLSTVCGCGLVGSLQDAGRDMVRYFSPREADYDIKPDEEKHQWDVVGEHARGVRGSQRDSERWYKDYIQSDEARDIERSLGVD